MKVKVAIVDAFIDRQDGGNPAGVVLNADALTDIQKRTIAAQVGLSETAFVSQSKIAGFKLDFYTPQQQIAHCGHATIATFSHLSQLGLVNNGKTSKETIDGIRNIEVLDDYAYMTQSKPHFISNDLNLPQILDAIGLDENKLISSPSIVNTGNSFLIMGVKTQQDLESIKPKYKAIEAISNQYDLIGFYIFTLETNKDERDASTRMFAPRYGIEEESATGMAAGPLACFLHEKMALHKDTFYIEQGYSMQPASPSVIEVVLNRDNKSIVDLKAGGIGKLSKYVNLDI